MENRDLVPDYQLDQVGLHHLDRCTGIDPHLNSTNMPYDGYEGQIAHLGLWWFPWAAHRPGRKGQVRGG